MVSASKIHEASACEKIARLAIHFFVVSLSMINLILKIETVLCLVVTSAAFSCSGLGSGSWEDRLGGAHRKAAGLGPQVLDGFCGFSWGPQSLAGANPTRHNYHPGPPNHPLE